MTNRSKYLKPVLSLTSIVVATSSFATGNSWAGLAPLFRSIIDAQPATLKTTPGTDLGQPLIPKDPAKQPAVASSLGTVKLKWPSLVGQSPAAAKPVQAGQPGSDPDSRWWPHPLNSPPFPLADWISESQQPIGETWDVGDGPLQKALIGDKWDKQRIRLYGWLDFGYTESTSKHSNFPLSYGTIPNLPVLDQEVIRLERMPDTVQTTKNDWGFRVTQVFGTDYRYLIGDGYFFDQLQKRNQMYGYDLPEFYGLLYYPKLAPLGGVVQIGRYISPADVECQLAPQNYLYSHTLMYTVDPYTYTGVNLQQQWSKTWSTMIGFDAGNDKSWWEKSREPNFEFLVGWHSPDNKDDVWIGPDQIGNGHFSWGHDSEQIFTTTWGHKFNDRWHIQSEHYYMWSYDALMGGTETDGPAQTFAGGGGPGKQIPGMSHANGYTSYLMYQSDKWSYYTFRTDMLNDPQGWRTGIPGNQYSLTLGYCHWLSPTTTFRPELRYDWADHQAFDNGTRKTQITLAADIIFHF